MFKHFVVCPVFLFFICAPTCLWSGLVLSPFITVTEWPCLMFMLCEIAYVPRNTRPCRELWANSCQEQLFPFSPAYSHCGRESLPVRQQRAVTDPAEGAISCWHLEWAQDLYCETGEGGSLLMGEERAGRVGWKQGDHRKRRAGERDG